MVGDCSGLRVEADIQRARHKTVHTRDKKTLQNLPGQNIPDKKYRTKYTLSNADQLFVPMPEIVICFCEGIDDSRKE